MRKSLVLVLVSGAFCASNASLLTNGSFEEPYVTTFDQFADGQVPGWKVGSTNLMEVGLASVYQVTGATGRNVVELDSNRNVGVYQDVALTQGSYRLTFDYALRGANLEGRNPDTCDFQVMWNSQQLVALRPGSSTMSTLTFDVTANQGVNRLTFVGMGTNDGMGAIIDNANLNPVPEPTSLAAMLVAVPLAIKRRRKDRG